MPARTPGDVDRLFAEALNAGNLEALVALYEPEAVLMPQPGMLVHGIDAIRESLAQFISGKPKISLKPRLNTYTSDLAIVSATWELSMTGPDGKPVNMAGQSVEVMRRRSDGTWRFAIDLPFGVVA
ncbi:MAG TPA: SgcJ/EcaC family oxidoreductase [Casimicrobiaceae bacterium]|nr:SgcJ/EcaC family oxidoreductase [Casimicrobiaceae bacterium]